MTQFHQDHQQVAGSQYNAGRDIHTASQPLSLDAIHSLDDVSTLLAHIQDAVTQATAEGHLPKKTAIATKAALDTTIVELEEPTPDKKTLLSTLSTAKSLLTGVAAVSALVPGLVTALEAVQKLF